MHSVRLSPLALILLLFLPLVAPAQPVQKETQWQTVFDPALAQARKQDKIVIAYFSGSDWDPWCQKLDKEVLDTELFRAWAAKNVILFRADFPRDKRISSIIKGQNDRLKEKYSVIKTPTFILMDGFGMPFARAGYDQAKLRENEAKGQPNAWIKYLEETIANKPKDETLLSQPGLTPCLNYATKHYISALLLITQGRAPRIMQMRDELLKNQIFVKFVNRNMAFAQVEWPLDFDTSADAVAFRAFIEKQSVHPAAMQLVVWDMQRKKVMAKIASIDPDHIDKTIKKIETQLPRIDYSGGWIDDYRKSQAISQQQDRYILLAFTSAAGEWSKRMEQEIFYTPQFGKYARKNLVTVKLDYTNAATQPVTLQTQNKTLAEMYNIRGFPTVIVLNPQGRIVATARYMKGGPGPFMKELQTAIANDQEQRAYLKGDKE
ncbi:MAG TPA: thioredoxin family protein [Tepidisphaeraceae bacterium]|nr:thioredoxin family protein [Tepidisphaeraceae bacterium]